MAENDYSAQVPQFFICRNCGGNFTLMDTYCSNCGKPLPLPPNIEVLLKRENSEVFTACLHETDKMLGLKFCSRCGKKT